MVSFEHLWPSEATWAAAAGALKDAVPALANHLWQSTVFALASAVLVLTLKANQARARCWVWMAASLKFVLPFALLAAIGSHLARPRAVAAPAQQTMYFAVEDFSEPFAAPEALASPLVAPKPQLRRDQELALAGTAVWLAGFVTILVAWCVRWRRVARAVHAAAAMNEGRVADALRRIEQAAGVKRAIALRVSEGVMEPGVFGAWRQVLLWPAGISSRLDDAQLEAVLAHEVCHVRRRDNLTAALHMLVEAAFWFHPLVWWLGARLLAERERACDEAVLLVCARPQAYAESILKVCEFCVESPVACVSGVTGADLKQRVIEIMTGRAARKLTLARKLLIAAIAVGAVGAPIVFGELRMLPIYGQVLHAAGPLPAYEVATIKPVGGPIAGNLAKDIRRFTGTTKELIESAYNIPYGAGDRVVGGPGWLSSDQYVVEGKVPDDLMARMQTMEGAEGRRQNALMKQSLLAEGFKLKVHFELRELPVYSLVVAKGGSKVKTADPNASQVPLIFPPTGGAKPAGPNAAPARGPIYYANTFGPSHRLFVTGDGRGVLEMTTKGVAMDNVAQSLEEVVDDLGGRTIVNKTGLDGQYDFTLKWTNQQTAFTPAANADSAAAESDAPSIFTALEEQLGLKLVPAKGMVEVVVIDHIEKPSLDGAEVQRPEPAKLSEQSLDAPAPGFTAQYSRYAQFTNSFQSPVPANVSFTARYSRSAGFTNLSQSSTGYAFYAQTAAAAARPAFEAATIKPNVSDCCTSSKMSADQMVLTHETLKNLIVLAYAVQPYQVVTPDWMENVRFDITAKYPPGTKYDDRWPMLRTLLEDRFGLKVHRDTKEMTGYSLLAASGGFKLKPSEPGEGNTVGGNQGNVWTFRAYKIGMPVLAWELSDSLGEVVVDKTGLDGVYDYQLRWANNGPTNPGASDTDAPSIFTALEETLGLRLQHGKVQADVIVVDHAERVPTEN